MGQRDYQGVLKEMRLADGTFWPLPVTLPVDPAKGVEAGKTLALRDVYGNLVGLLHVDEIFEFDRALEAQKVYGTDDATNQGVGYLNAQPSHYASGKLEVVRTPPHYDFVPLRLAPAEVRREFEQRGWSKVVAFHTTAPIFRAQEEIVKRAVTEVGGGLLIHPTVGVTKPGDVEHYSRIRSYKALMDHAFDPKKTVLSLLPYARRSAGQRETLMLAIIRRNYGCSHLIVNGGNDTGSVHKHQNELEIELVKARSVSYSPELDSYLPREEIKAGATTAEINEVQAKEHYLAKGIPLPAWFARPEVADILAETCPPKHRQGLTIWFTGLSGSGKSTIAHALVERLAEFGRNVSFLDGDEIRTHLSKGLGFSKEDRDTNINRVGYVAGLIAAQGGTTICSVVSPYRASRENARRLSKGNFVEIFCDTPIDVCETRDVKGLYAKARAAVADGKGMSFTGIDDPYEPPINPEVTLDTSRLGVAECVEMIVARLKTLGFIRD